MPLSERDRHVLAEMEQQLLAADLSSGKPGQRHRSRTGPTVSTSVGATLGVLAGLGYVLLGLLDAGVLGVVGAVVGFAIIVVSCSRVVGAHRTPRRSHLAEAVGETRLDVKD